MIYLRIILRRIAGSLPALAGVLVVTFFLTRALPGDPAAYLAGPAAGSQAIEEIRSSLGLDRSYVEQFVLYLRDLSRGDLGASWSTGQPVLIELTRRFPASLELTLTGLLITMIFAIPLGIASALKPNSPIDHTARIVSTIGVSLPTFFMGLLLLYIFYYLLGIAPGPTGRLSLFTRTPPSMTGFYLIDSLLAGRFSTFREALSHIILPALTLGLFALAPMTRMTRASMLKVLSSDYIRTARANRIPQRKIIYTYALRNAIIPVLTTLGMVFSFLLGANVLVEKVFSWPGIGSYALEALIISDYAAVQGFVLLMGILYVLVNLFIDLLYIVMDPRVRVEA